MKKIAFYGNSCTGKTSSLYAIASELTCAGKSFRIANMPYDNSGHVTNPKPFSTNFLESTPASRLHFIFEMLANETRLMTNPDVDFYLTDMTNMDLFYLYKWVSRLCQIKNLYYIEQLCTSWMSSYHVIFKMKDDDFYFQDGSRHDKTVVKKAMAPYYRKGGDFSGHDIEGPVGDRRKVVLEIFKELYL